MPTTDMIGFGGPILLGIVGIVVHWRLGVLIRRDEAQERRAGLERKVR